VAVDGDADWRADRSAVPAIAGEHDRLLIDKGGQGRHSISHEPVSRATCTCHVRADSFGFSAEERIVMASAQRLKAVRRRRPALPFAGLWRHADFRRLWAAQFASLFGSEITAPALPLMAVLALDASSVQMGLLAAAKVNRYRQRHSS
jgi:hypothetical protein